MIYQNIYYGFLRLINLVDGGKVNLAIVNSNCIIVTWLQEELVMSDFDQTDNRFLLDNIKFILKVFSLKIWDTV